jgi:hypothetical protein
LTRIELTILDFTLDLLILLENIHLLSAGFHSPNHWPEFIITQTDGNLMDNPALPVAKF